MNLFLFLIYIIFTLLILYKKAPGILWEIGSLIYLVTSTLIIGMHWFPAILLWLIVLAVFCMIHVELFRSSFVNFIYKKAQKSIPKLSKTEEEALQAGETWLEKDIFTGNPDWDKLASVSTGLSTEEQKFLDNETQILCDMLDDWKIRQEKDLPKKVWTYLKKQGFLGLVIPKKYGGKGFSARAHSDIIVKIGSVSGVAAVTVMVPNSLGPGELLHYYGTQEQKDKYLPKLAKGEEIPCFALTEPTAGSDAVSIQSEAIVVKRTVSGKKVLSLHIPNLNKRWITMSPVATLIGLAVLLKDPDSLLEEGMEGITCLLIPRDTKNLEIGNRHLPTDQPFMNGTIRGKDIFVPIDTIIGGQKNAGAGWKMLVECLSIGRSISLPALSAASTSIAYLATGAYARIRRQFNVEIGQFEGVEEKLAEIAGLNYLVNATRLLTVGAVNEHKKPSVASAITKYFNTEFCRIVINDAMDVHGGRTVVVGPKNYLYGHYTSLPISITVEGANIMSRNLLIFGQGSMACHPFLKDEFYALAQGNKAAFGNLLWKHLFYFLNNFAKTIITAWTAGFFIATPVNSKELKREYQKLSRLSYAFSWLADLSLIYLGGELKRKERLSARLADGMSYLYIAMAVLRLQTQKEPMHNELHSKWALAYCYYHAQKSLIALCNNFPSKLIGWIIRIVAFPLGQTMTYPGDRLDHQLAQCMMSNNNYRELMKHWIFLDTKGVSAISKMEETFQNMLKNKDAYAKIADLKRYNLIKLRPKLQQKVDIGELTQQEMDNILAVEEARLEAIQVDEFPFESMSGGANA
jgi:alkylation response protein AidB-like acyl-CoA dehydrogenase